MRALRQWYPAVIWAAAIWLFSMASFSARSTSHIILPVLHWLLPWASREALDLVPFLIRKSAHFVEFFIFSLLVLPGIRGERPGWKLAWGVAAVLIAACCAALDEFHQSLVPGRMASPMDSLLDTCGAAAAPLLAWLRMRWRSGHSRTPA